MRKRIAETIEVLVDESSEQELAKWHREHLGASIIGDECSRELFYSFRWAYTPKLGQHSERTAGQMLRLFDRGSREEPEIIKWLSKIGCEIVNVDKFTNEQFRILDCQNHFGGSLDGKIKLPPQFNFHEIMLLEMKTFKDSEFRKLVKNGVKVHCPKYWAQMCVYGYKSWLKYGFFVGVNKDNDDWHVEILELDQGFGADLIRRAYDIIFCPPAYPPMRIAENPAHFSCKWCSAKDICHHGVPPNKNCRSCLNSRPAAEGKWLCQLHEKEIDQNLMRVGCDQWNPIS